MSNSFKRDESSFQKFRKYSYGVGGGICSGANNIYGDISVKGSKFLKGANAKCKRNNSNAVNGAEGLKEIFKIIGKAADRFERRLPRIQ